VDSRIQAALIAAFSALVGVVVGGYIQTHLKDRELQREKKVAEGATTLYLCRLRSLFEVFSDHDRAYNCLHLGISPNTLNMSEVEMVINVIKSHDPFVLVKLFDIRQNLNNIKIYSKSYHRIVEEGGSYKAYEPYIGMMTVDGKHGLKTIDLCIKQTFNHTDLETRKYLLANEEFKKFLPKIVGDSWFQRLRVKFNFVEKI